MVEVPEAGPVEKWLEEKRFEEVEWYDFYREIFGYDLENPRVRNDEGEWAYESGKYHAVAVRVRKGPDGKDRACRYTITNDLWDPLWGLVNTNDFCIMSPVSYAGKTQAQVMARYLYAVAIDLDGVVCVDGCARGLDELWFQAHKMRKTKARIWAVPVPTFMVSSGTGVHLYYVLKRPVPLFPNVIKQLRALRYGLVRVIWNDRVTTLSGDRQYEAVTQGFRIVGTVKKDGRRVRAFRTGDPVSLEYLNEHVREEERVTTFAYKSDLSLAKAKELYPQWYQRRIVEGQPRGSWTVKRDLYEWWKRTLVQEAREGHRYFCIMVLAIYARKCAVSLEELTRDALGFVSLLSERGAPFTQEDVMKALAAYDESYITFPRAVIERLAGIRIDANKRNGLDRASHLKIARTAKAVKKEAGVLKRDGRPRGSGTKQRMVWEWRQAHPQGRKIECHRETGLSRVTIDKWWDTDYTPPRVQAPEAPLDLFEVPHDAEGVQAA